MKKPIILILPIAAQLLLFASGIPIQQNRDNGVVRRSFPSHLFPIDSTLVQRSDSRQAFSVLVHRPRNPDRTSSPSIPPAAQGTNPSMGSSLSSTQQSPVSSSHDVNNRPSSSGPALVNGGAPYGEDRLPELQIQEAWYALSYEELAQVLIRRAKEGTSLSKKAQVIQDMRIMIVMFERYLEHAQSDREHIPSLGIAMLKWWGNEMLALVKREGVSESPLVRDWKIMLTRQIRAIAQLDEGKKSQTECDNDWVDSPQSSTTILRMTQPRADESPYVLCIDMRSIPHDDLTKLKSDGHTFKELITIAEKLEKRDNKYHRPAMNALVLRRKAIQMWLRSGMSTEEFDGQEVRLRHSVTEGTADESILAEMAIISLHRFMKDEKIQLTKGGPGA
ncbi:hypothetical protein H0H93_015665 [Arthromyces matolae]|nr:hypothetical protein H0H93_015665 [Arthromyces matolae]